MSSTFFFWLTLAVGYLLTDDDGRSDRWIEIANPVARRYWLAVPISLGLIVLAATGMRAVIRSYQSDILLKRAAIYSSRGRNDSALRYLNRALALRPDSVEALEGLARAYNGLGDRDRADAVLEKVQSLRGD